MRRRFGAALPAVVASAWLAASPALAAINYPASSGILRGTTASIGGTALLAGGCSTATVTIAGATTAMVVDVTPAANPGGSTQWSGIVTAAGVVTVSVCVIAAGTPTATTYNVRVIP